MSARSCRSAFHRAATDSGIDEPYSNAAITLRACASDTRPSRPATATLVARRSISLRPNRPFAGIVGRRAVVGGRPHRGRGRSAVVVTPGMCAAVDDGTVRAKHRCDRSAHDRNERSLPSGPAADSWLLHCAGRILGGVEN